MKRDREYDSCECEIDVSRKYILVNDSNITRQREQNKRKINVSVFGINGMLYGNFTLDCDVSVQSTLSKIKSDILCSLKVPFTFHDQFDLIAKKSSVHTLFFILSGKLQNILRNNLYNK